MRIPGWGVRLLACLALATTLHAQAPDQTEQRIVILGDSLTAGLGLPPQQAYPMVLQQRVDAAGLRYKVINGGVSGDTSAGGLDRINLALEGNVRVLILAVGANDGLRGLPVDELKRNLTKMIERAVARGITVVLAGMEAPPNYGPKYTTEFRNVFPDLAMRYKLKIIPFLLQGVAADPRLNQRDGIHPNAQGARIVADNVWAVLAPIIEPRPARGRSVSAR